MKRQHLEGGNANVADGILVRIFFGKSRREFEGGIAPLFLRCLLGATALVFADQCIADEGHEFFERRIRPVLVEHCYECHSGESESVEGGLRVDHRRGLLIGGDSGPALQPGEAEQSLLVQALRYESFEMPPEGRLPRHVIDDFINWIDMGAPDPRRAT